MDFILDSEAILFVEDDRKIGNIIKGHLEQENFIVMTACDGEGALLLFYKEEPDLILLDLMLSKLGGMDILKK
ncbi:response regulator [Cytobacillus purgationiresistens]|uniref:DNA-binding response OmpR family regulator n=1 Tax=Cytobacillus purgationiresistens TaxID=863449 RepID=A0ABU0AKN3_9BACI|nr:response regulator [Cytobacillus purgationiresistens]MDQ0271444.1 DNA-binding response OmpR family regulator [Cytobacillus purgationiresistens]